LQDYRDFAFLTEVSLAFALRAAGVEPNERIAKPLLEKYLDLDPYPEAKEALGKLKNRGGCQLAILSNGSTSMLTTLAKNSGLDVFFDAIISVDGARKFKPHPDCYALVQKTLGLKNDEVIFVSSNGFDVAGAKHFGFKVAWIRRGGAASAMNAPIGPAQMYRLLRGNAETLGYLQDYTVAALTDLTNLL
jgi:2-haloacid dehalogenase